MQDTDIHELTRRELADKYDRHDENVAAVAREVGRPHTVVFQRLVELEIHEPSTRLHDVLVQEDVGPEDVGLQEEEVRHV